jgi:hypothetical protein
MIWGFHGCVCSDYDVLYLMLYMFRAVAYIWCFVFWRRVDMLVDTKVSKKCAV